MIALLTLLIAPAAANDIMECQPPGPFPPWCYPEAQYHPEPDPVSHPEIDQSDLDQYILDIQGQTAIEWDEIDDLVCGIFAAQVAKAKSERDKAVNAASLCLFLQAAYPEEDIDCSEEMGAQQAAIDNYLRVSSLLSSLCPEE